MTCGRNQSSGLVEGKISATMADLFAAAKVANTQTVSFIDDMLGIEIDVPTLVSPITFASAVAGYAPFVLPDTPAMPVFGDAPVVTMPDTPTLADGVDLDYIDGLSGAVTDYVAGAPEADIYAHLRAAQDRLTAADVQAAGERMAAAGWAAPAGVGVTMIRQATERGAASVRDAMRAAWAETRGRAIEAGLSAVRGQNEAITARNAATSNNFDVAVRGGRYALDVFETTVRAKSQAFDASARVFTALLGAQSARVEADSRLFALDIENARSMNDARLRDREISINATLRADQLRQSGAQSAAEIMSRIASGAMSGMHVSASMSSGVSASDSTSCSTNYSIDATPAE